jgi:hypothetical protein
MRFIALGAAIIVAIGAYVAYWMSVAHAVPPALARWAESERAKGREVDLGEPTVEGFPFRIVVRLPKVGYGAPALENAPRYEGERLTAVAQPWNLRHVIVRADGPQRVSWQDAPNAQRRSALVEAERAFASVVARGDEVERIAVDLTKARVTADGVPGPVAIGRLQVHTRHPEPPPPGDQRPTPPGQFEAAVEAENVSLPAPWGSSLGQTLERASIMLKLTGKLDPDAGREGVAAWRDGGGTLEVERVNVRWGRLDAAGDGTLALDDRMRPMGAFGLHVAGWEAGIDAAVADGRIPKRAGDTARTALGLLSLGAKDAEGRLTIPVTLQNGAVLLGPVPVAELGPLF